MHTTSAGAGALEALRHAIRLVHAPARLWPCARGLLAAAPPTDTACIRPSTRPCKHDRRGGGAVIQSQPGENAACAREGGGGNCVLCPRSHHRSRHTPSPAPPSPPNEHTDCWEHGRERRCLPNSCTRSVGGGGGRGAGVHMCAPWKAASCRAPCACRSGPCDQQAVL